MSRADGEAMARIAGMEYALRRIREIGVEAFAKEILWRNRTRIGMTIKPQEIGEASEAIKAQTYDTMLVMALLVLHDEFGFGHDRLMRFERRFNTKAACLEDNFAEWEDYRKILLDECGIDTGIRWNRKEGK